MMVNGTLSPSGVYLGTVTSISYTPICPGASPAKITGSATPLSAAVGCATATAGGSEGDTVPEATGGEVSPSRAAKMVSESPWCTGLDAVTCRPLKDRMIAGRLVDVPACPLRNTAGAVEPTVKLKSGLLFCGVRMVMIDAPVVWLSSCALINDGETESSEIGCPFTVTQLPRIVGNGTTLEAMVAVLKLMPKSVMGPPKATPVVPPAALATLEISGCGRGAS